MMKHLPEDVIQSIRCGKKIEAIKKLRDANRLGLKEAKQAVEAYIDQSPELRQKFMQNTNMNTPVSFLLGICILVALVVYQILFKT